MSHHDDRAEHRDPPPQARAPQPPEAPALVVSVPRSGEVEGEIEGGEGKGFRVRWRVSWRLG